MNRDIEKVFSPRNIDSNCDLISNLMLPFAEDIKRFVLAGEYSMAIKLFLQLSDATCRHFMSEEHYDYFADNYSPAYTLDWAFSLIANALHEGKLSPEEQIQLKFGLDELGESEAFQNYGYPSIDNWKENVPQVSFRNHPLSSGSSSSS